MNSAKQIYSKTLANGDVERSLKLQWFSQLDNYDAAGYTCNSCMCWTMACFNRPELVAKYGPNGDYDFYYKQLVQPYGDTTDHGNQTTALDYLGVKTVWRTNVTLDEVARHIETRGQPVGIGILHNGSLADQPKLGLSGGHMLTLYGTYRDKAGALVGFLVADSNGEIDLADGGYRGMPTRGSALRYSYKNLKLRFETDADGYYTPGPCGWARLFV